MLKGLLYYKLENVSISAGHYFRHWGQQLFRAGMANQGASAHEDRIVPSLRCVPTSAGVFPKLLDSDWIAPNATVIGNV
jgi:hypothetical protein